MELFTSKKFDLILDEFKKTTSHCDKCNSNDFGLIMVDNYDFIKKTKALIICKSCEALYSWKNKD